MSSPHSDDLSYQKTENIPSGGGVPVEKDIVKDDIVAVQDANDTSSETLDAKVAYQVNHRRLNSRQIQLTSIAGSIGAALFVAIGYGLLSGPLALLLGFTFWCSVVFCVAQCRESFSYAVFAISANPVQNWK